MNASFIYEFLIYVLKSQTLFSHLYKNIIFDKIMYVKSFQDRRKLSKYNQQKRQKLKRKSYVTGH